MKIENEYLLAEFTELGAECTKLFSKTKNCPVFWEKDNKTWTRTSPILFPFVAEFAGKNLPKHGFARDLNFQYRQISPTEIEFKLRQNETTLKIFPYFFEFTVTYRLKNNKFIVNFNIHCNEENPENLMLGFHPAFYSSVQTIINGQIDFQTNEKLESLSLIMDKIMNPTASNPEQIQTKKIILSENTDITDALIIKNLLSNSVIFDQPEIQLKINTSFPSFAIWTPNSEKFVCLEGWALEETQDHYFFEVEVL